MSSRFPAKLLCLQCMLLMMLLSAVQAQEAKIKVTGLRSKKGKIVLLIFKDHASFENSEPYKVLSFKKTTINKGSVIIHITLPLDTFGVLLLDDENDNQKMDMNSQRIPMEGFGFSNFYLHGKKRPVFEDFKIHISPANCAILIKVNYL